MSDNSAIEWTDASWNPIRARNIKTGKVGWYCEHATTGCEFCYAEGFNKRLGTGLPFKPGHRKDVEIFLDDVMLTLPLRWKRPRMIFVCSMTDLFADFVPDEWIDKVFAVMALAPQHTFQVLTKRAKRMREYVPGAAKRIVKRTSGGNPSVTVSTAKAYHSTTKVGSEFVWPLPNVWLGVSTERQQEADERIPELLQTPAAVRFISAEPLLGPIDLIGTLARFQDNPNRVCAVPLGRQLIDWVIVGGESGPGARPMHPDWPRGLRDQCAAAGIAFFFKQWGAYQANFPQYADEFGMEETDMLCFGYEFPAEGVLYRNGHFYDGVEYQPHTGVGAYWVARVGKKSSGRLLDGVEHNGMPEIERARP